MINEDGNLAAAATEGAPQDGRPSVTFDADLEKGSSKRKSSLFESLGLSIISKKYDLGGKGHLDPVEQALRDLDTSGRGDLANEKAYIIMQSLHQEQKKNVTLKKLLWALAAFAVVMSLSVLGLSFAAASLAKDTTVDKSTHNFMTKDGTDVIGTKAVAGTQLNAIITGSSSSCVSVTDLSKSYKEIKGGSSVNVVTTSETGAETARTLNEASKNGDTICLGHPASHPICYTLGNPCGYTGEEDSNGGSRRLEQTKILHRNTFDHIVKGAPRPERFLMHQNQCEGFRLSCEGSNHPCCHDFVQEDSGATSSECGGGETLTTCQCGNVCLKNNQDCSDGCVECGSASCTVDDGCCNSSCGICGSVCTEQFCVDGV